MMDLSSSFKKSFKRHSRKISAGNLEDELKHEEKPILADHHHRHLSPSARDHDQRMERSSSLELNPRSEVIVKIDGVDQTTTSSPMNMNVSRGMQGENRMWRDQNYDYWNKNSAETPSSTNPFEIKRGKDLEESPPTKLISQFMKKQKALGGEMSLDFDLEMEDFQREQNYSFNNPNRGRDSMSKDLKVSFCQTPSMKNIVNVVHEKNNSSSDEEGHNHNQRRSTTTLNNNFEGTGNGNRNSTIDEQVVKCTSFQKRGSQALGRAKTRSRLMDPSPDTVDKKSGKIAKSGTMRSGMLNRASGMLSKPPDDDDDDPFDDDIPDDFKARKVNALILLQWASLVVIGTSLICTLTIGEWKKKKFRGLHLWKWQVLVLVLICGRLVSGWWIRLIVFFIERNFLLRKKVLYFVYGVRKAVQNCIWLGFLLIAWHFMFDKEVSEDNSFLEYVNKLMLSMLVATMLWLVKTLMVKVLASSFHVSTFFDRIQESLFNQYVIETLSGPPLVEIQNNQEEEDRTMAEVWRLQNAGATFPPELMKSSAFPSTRGGPSSRVGVNGGGGVGGVGGGGGLPPRPITRGLSFKNSGQLSKKQEEPGISIDHLHRLNPKNISAWNMKRLMRIVRHGSLSTLDEQLLGSTTQDDESSTEIKSENEAKSAARKIFRNVAQPRSKFIYKRDLMRFMQENESVKVMELVEGSPDSEKISKSSLKAWVVNAFRERKALALTLNDTKTAVNKLHQMVNVLVGIIILLICLVIFGIATSKFLVFVSSQIVVVAFIFGNTCKTIFEAIIFLFVMHPFDVGDRCEIDDVQMIVEEMNILNTIFLKVDNQKVMYPNSTLSTRPIGNFYRSPDMLDIIDFSIHVATPPEKIALVKQRIISLVEAKKEHYYPEPTIAVLNLECLNKIKMSVWFRHRMNFQDSGTRWLRRGLLIEEMAKVFRDCDLEYRLYPVDINIRSMAPTSNRYPSTWPAPPSSTS